ncbi:5-formyltetrahydrofolate cyclo-ligase [Nakamurella flavida]|uniref:5-formyltetrahydrofolate cyclo-ligase n=1 Tax=Nakamurella flavida TaxID=363630 RepID=A0A938YHV7_9ACTN|nr:5-formyltetrahydrofolate cyclo-ligase [Nakamurella flavida]MBM9476212.1 5-formyltetrahydrofolate cyclo-ligase [Nakamurella flavida]MDP9779690.1 5-formyltetrahydrofolate cyclo-ligase [Nakamurella flavida]
MDPVAEKIALRTALLAGRRGRSTVDRVAAQDALDAHLRDLTRGRSALALFLPLPTEPVSRRTVDALAGTHRVLLPVATAGRPLDWAEAGGGVRRGAFGIDEPAGPTAGPDALERVDLVLVPALAVDRSGRRLGRGGGHYDRTLALLAGLPVRPMIVAVVFDAEVLDSIPVEETDRVVDAVLTPTGGLSPTPHHTP